MAEKRESSERGRGPAWAGALLVILPALYCLSTGPVIWLWTRADRFHGLVSIRQLQTFYWPIVWLHDHTFMEQPIDWYISLWGVG